MLFPRIGRKAWILTDVYEKTCAVPVTVIPLEQSDLWELLAAAQGAARPRYAVRWQVCEGRDEYHVITIWTAGAACMAAQTGRWRRCAEWNESGHGPKL